MVSAYVDLATTRGLALLQEIESVLKIDCAPVSWPLGMGKAFRGVFDLRRDRLHANIIKRGQIIDSIRRRIPLRRWGATSELGALAVYLAGDGSTWHTGDEFRVDGGFHVM